MAPFQISIFKTLRELYPTWDALKTHLISEEGGKFSIRDCENTSFAIIRYKKGETVLGENGHWLRSVVWDKEKHLPVCVAPRKANAGPPPTNTQLTAEEFYDGVMVNAFSCLATGGEKVHLTTRSQYDASGSFYSAKSFKTLFEEAGLSLSPYLTCTTEYPATFISTVLQHPENRIVANVTKPTVYVVESGKVRADGLIEMDTMVSQTPVVFPMEKDAYEMVRKEAVQRGWRWQGFVFRDTLGNRWRLRSSTYTYLRALRGNDSKPIERFLRLRAAATVTEYLKHYSEERQIFWNFETELRNKTRQIYDAYVSVHKSHEKKLADLQQPDKTVVFKLHAHYLANLREQKKPLRIQDTIDLVNSLPLWEQALLLSKSSTTTLSSSLSTLSSDVQVTTTLSSDVQVTTTLSSDVQVTTDKAVEQPANP
jgi:hypothetical protein